MRPTAQPGDVFAFDFAPAYRVVGRLFGVTEDTADVTVAADSVRARFGPWHVETDLANIADVRITGPYRFLKTAGPARLSLADRGLTLATNGHRGVCLSFHVPIPEIEPTGPLRHPNLTVTVADFRRLAETISA